MIELTEVTKEYSKGVSALNGINLKIKQGEFVFIVGEINPYPSDYEGIGTYIRYDYCEWTRSGQVKA